MKISNYSLNYAALIAERTMDVFQFLALCRELGLEGASLHLQNLQSTQPDYLKQIRRAYLDHGLSVSIFTVSTDFGQPEEKHEEEFKKFRQALRAAELLGAPLIRVFPGSPRSEADRQNAFDRSAAAVRRACEEAAQAGVPVGLQNHNHGALCRTGEEVIRFIKKVDHPNFTFVLDTGQFAGSQGASGQPPAELRDANFMESIRQTASLARYVRVKFYSPRPDGSEPAIPYDKVFDILQGVHYSGFIDIVYEPRRIDGKPGRMCARPSHGWSRFFAPGYRLHPPDSRRRRGGTRVLIQAATSASWSREPKPRWRFSRDLRSTAREIVFSPTAR